MAHIHELIDFVVNIVITHKNRVLLIHHKKLNMWLPIGGHVELDEDPDQALFREVKEECGLEIEVLNKKPNVVSEGTKFLYTPSFVDIHNISESHKHVCLVYFAESKSDKFILNEEEHINIKWFEEKELDDPSFLISQAVKFYCKEALKNNIK